LVTGIVAASLILAGLAEWMQSKYGRQLDWCVPAVLVCSVVGVVGAVALGWYGIKLSGSIASIADRLKSELPTTIKPTGNILTDKLIEAVNNRLDGYRSRTDEFAKQIKDSQVQLQLLNKRRINTEAILYGIRDAVLVTDEFDRLSMANEAAGKLFGFDFKNSQYKSLNELINADKTEFTDLLRQCRQNKVIATRRKIEFSGSACHIAKNDNETPAEKIFDCVLSCVCDEKKEICGVVAVLHDVTREKEISRMKDDFVSHVSHELKTPLASITAYSEMLLDGEADNEQTRKEFYSIIQNQAKRLNRMIDDILNAARIESGLIKIEKKPVSLTILIEEQMPMIKSFAEEKNITVSWGHNGQKPIVFDQVYGDRDMISQVIVNLMSNAVKYTPSGGSVKIKNEVDDVAGLAKVSVTDTGVGIPDDELKYVFDKFYRVKANQTHAKGTGLGLSLVKQIIEKIHNGKVFVKSKLGAGSTFGFELPLAQHALMQSAS
jgi:two-component system phosphate regulon sensor histidine kinase PhoR